mmetsp:Transcript_22810/g.65240  ORF Transcript_22810/g.65240 Transcript_22810/m.65240 type:complete len:122 (-) Transcript_22810:471-836(-)
MSIWEPPPPAVVSLHRHTSGRQQVDLSQLIGRTHTLLNRRRHNHPCNNSSTSSTSTSSSSSSGEEEVAIPIMSELSDNMVQLDTSIRACHTEAMDLSLKIPPGVPCSHWWYHLPPSWGGFH